SVVMTFRPSDILIDRYCYTSPFSPSLLFLPMIPPPPRSTLFPYTTLFRSSRRSAPTRATPIRPGVPAKGWLGRANHPLAGTPGRSEEHTSELQSQSNLVCRLLLEKKKKKKKETRVHNNNLR